MPVTQYFIDTPHYTDPAFRILIAAVGSVDRFQGTLFTKPAIFVPEHMRNRVTSQLRHHHLFYRVVIWPSDDDLNMTSVIGVDVLAYWVHFADHLGPFPIHANIEDAVQSLASRMIARFTVETCFIVSGKNSRRFNQTPHLPNCKALTE